MGVSGGGIWGELGWQCQGDVGCSVGGGAMGKIGVSGGYGVHWG